MNKTVMAAAVAMCLLLAGCGEKEVQHAPYDSGSVQALMDGALFSENLEELDAEIACRLFGVDEGLVSECEAYMPTSTNAEVLALFVLSDSEDAADVKTALESWVSEQIASYQDYGPQHVPKLEGAVISVRENTVLVVVGSDPDTVKSAVDNLE